MPHEPEQSHGQMIAYLAHRFPVGTQTFTYDEVRHLAIRGVDFEVFSFRPGDELGWPLNDIKVRVLPSVRSGDMLAALVRCAASHPIRLMRAAIWCTSAALVRGRTMRARISELLALPRGAFLAQLPRVKLYHAQFANEAATTALVAAYLADRYFSFRSHTSPNPPLLRQKLRRARLVVAISDYDRAYLLGQEPNAHVEVARLGVDILDSSEAVCHPGLIVSVGSLIDKKGHDLLIEAVRRLRERALDVSLTIIGAGPEGDRLMRQIRSAGLDGVVHLTGHLPRSETLELMANAEVCALASRPSRLTGQDGVPVALMEALACGKACVSTRVSGIPELVIDGETGLLVPPDDPSRLASALESLLTDEEARERLGQAGRRLIADRYDAFTNYGRLAGLLEQAAR